MSIFHLKKNDTRPSLQVVLKNPDDTVHDLAGSTSLQLHILLSNGTMLTRAMTQVGPDIDGTVKYDWADSDWNAGGLIVSPDLPGIEHKMEYEVVTGATRTTFPNNDYDILRILDDLGQ